MNFATANRTTVLRVKETTWGVTPATPALIQCRMTGEALDDTTKTLTSKEIRADRMVADLVVVDESPGGDLNFEMSYGSFTDLLESLLMTTLTTPLAIVGVAADISTVVAASPTANLTSTTAGKFSGIVLGQKIKLGGFTDPLNNIVYTVTHITDSSHISLTPTPNSAETPLLAAATIGGQMGRNGITEQSYTLIKVFNDATAVTNHKFQGMRVSAASFDMKTASLLGGKFSFKGKNASMDELVPPVAGATFPAVSSTTIMNCVTNVLNITQNGASFGSTGATMSATISIDNQHREQKGIGVLGNVGVVAGQLMVKVTASQYFESKAQSVLYKNSTGFAFSFTLSDDVGNTLVFTLPRCKYDSFKENATQLDSDVMAQTTFMALADPVTNCMIQVDFFPAP